MGSRRGYEYRYRFSMVHKHDVDEADADRMNSLSMAMRKLNLDDNFKAYLFQIRTDFILKKRTEEGGAVNVIIDSESFDAPSLAPGEDKKDAALLYHLTSDRLFEYWMTKDEIKSFVNRAVAFAKKTATTKLLYFSTTVIPLAVRLEVRTVQQEGESLGEAMDRAIRAQDLVPLYLWPPRTPRMARMLDESKPMTAMLKIILRNIHRIRVEDFNYDGVEWAPMKVCSICSRDATTGAQVSLLGCGHAFHSRCIVRWLEDNHQCPLCHYPIYRPWVAVAKPPKPPSGAVAKPPKCKCPSGAVAPPSECLELLGFRFLGSSYYF